MIARPSGLITIKRDVIFNYQEFLRLEIDLIHINKCGRSNLGVELVIDIVNKLINYSVLEAVEERQYGSVVCEYFVHIEDYLGKRYKIVFCICSARPTVIGVITLYRVKGVK